MSSPTIDDLQDSGVYTPPPQSEPSNGHGPGLKFIDADIGEFIKKPKTATAREYEHKVESALNAVMRFCAPNPKLVPDAAAIIAYGDNFAAAAGEVCDVSVGTRRMIDLILTPESPWLALAIAGIPLASQLMRNHETAIANVPKRFGTKEQRKAAKAARKETKAAQPRFTVKILGRTVGIHLPKVSLKIFTSQTVEPDALTQAVFSNEQVVKALKKRGIDVAYPL